MARTYSYRPYRPGDECAINELYYQVTGRRRTAAQFSWQWLEAPEGIADMWLIEATDDEGNVKLIGHHGVMPIAFSSGNTDLLFGKTENTMVLPEYRRRIIYPRFEKRFSKSYEEKYDALFSTMGPTAAIRQRKAMGYEFPVKWESVRCSTNGFFSETLFLVKNFMKKAFKIHRSLRRSYEILHRHGMLKDEEAENNVFFRDFWQQSRSNFCIAPRRNKEDLAWRFFHNPHKSHLTLVMDEGDVKGYCIISLSQKLAGEALLEDFCVQSNLSKHAAILLDRLCTKLENARIYSLKVICTEDSEISKYNLIDERKMLILSLIQEFKNKPKKVMPRKIVNAKDGLLNVGWDVTAIVLEGRA